MTRDTMRNLIKDLKKQGVLRKYEWHHIREASDIEIDYLEQYFMYRDGIYKIVDGHIWKLEEGNNKFDLRKELLIE